MSPAFLSFFGDCDRITEMHRVYPSGIERFESYPQSDVEFVSTKQGNISRKGERVIRKNP